MLFFDSNGLLTPYQNIKATIHELKHYFVHEIPSETRTENFEKFERYTEELKKVLQVQTLKQWINGSFVTNIKNPKDIDLITFIDFDLRDKFKFELKRFEAQGANELFGVDAYLLTVFPENNLKVFLYQSDRAYWMDKFTKTKRDKTGKKKPKGFLEIIH